VNVIAMSLGDGGHLRLVVDNHVHGAAVLRERGTTCPSADVLVVDTAGSLNALRLIADAGINLNYSYGAASAVILGVDDAIRASAVAGI